MALTTELAEAALSRPKRITQACEWMPRRNRRGLRLEVQVGFLNEQTGQWEIGKLEAVAYPGKSVSMALLFYGVPIRRLDHGIHPNPDRTRVTGIHKHRWHEDLNQRWAYKPDDMQDEELLEQPDKVFGLFLEECGIELVGSYQPFLT